MDPSQPDTDWEQALRDQRRAREEYFRESPHSPLPPELRGEEFPGLEYYPPDGAYRFVVELIEHEHPETVTVETTADGSQQYLRWGAFTVDIEGSSVTLQAYRPDRETDRFWVPFRDATSGETTYGAGRYLDLEPDTHQSPDGWRLDFNAAYNPTCAYNAAYECPLIPPANWLEVAIEAGEKDFPAEPAGHGHY